MHKAYLDLPRNTNGINSLEGYPLQKKGKGVRAVALGTVLVALSLLGMVSVNAHTTSGDLSVGEVDYWWISGVDKDDPVLVNIQTDSSFWESRVYYSNLTLIEEIYSGGTHIHEFIANKTDAYMIRLYSPYYSFNYTVESTHSISEQQPDTSPPVISVVSPENKSYPVNDIRLTLTVSEPTSWIGYSLNEQTNLTITGNITLPILPDGRHYVIVYANDTFGNMGASNLVHFTVDTNAPDITSITQTPLPNQVQPTDKVKVNSTITDNLGIKQVTLNCTYTNSTGTWSQTIYMINIEQDIWNATIPTFPYDTNITYVIIAEDNAGNIINSQNLGYECQYQVISEFPSFFIPLLFVAATLLTAIIYRRKRVGIARMFPKRICSRRNHNA